MATYEAVNPQLPAYSQAESYHAAPHRYQNNGQADIDLEQHQRRRHANDRDDDAHDEGIMGPGEIPDTALDVSSE